MISVVIPTCNDAHFLPTALASCLAQTVPVEIVLVDDASTTPFPEEVSRFIDDHREMVTIVRHAWNCGLSAARNSGIAQARFDLIIPLDADDWFLPGSLAPLVSVLSDDVDIAYGNVVDSGKLYEPVKRPLRREDFLQDNPLFCSSIFRRTVWHAVGGYMVRREPHYEDWHFWAKAFKAGFQFRYAPVTVYEHRSRPDSMLRHLHHQRARFVRIATEPLREPEPPAAAPVEPAPAEPAATRAAAAAPREELIDPSLASDTVKAVLRVLAGEACAPVAAAHGLDAEDLRQSVRRFAANGARALRDEEPRPTNLLPLHARIGQLMIELERTRAQLARVRDSGKSPHLVSAHAAIARPPLQRGQAGPANDGGS